MSRLEDILLEPPVSIMIRFHTTLPALFENNLRLLQYSRTGPQWHYAQKWQPYIKSIKFPWQWWKISGTFLVWLHVIREDILPRDMICMTKASESSHLQTPATCNLRNSVIYQSVCIYPLCYRLVCYILDHFYVFYWQMCRNQIIHEIQFKKMF